MTTTLTPVHPTTPSTPVDLGSAKAAALAVLAYRVSSRIVRTAIAAQVPPVNGTRTQPIAGHVRTRDAAWRHLADRHPAIARLVVEEDAVLQRLRVRRAHGEDTTDLFRALAHIRAELRNRVDDLRP